MSNSNETSPQAAEPFQIDFLSGIGNVNAFANFPNILLFIPTKGNQLINALVNQARPNKRRVENMIGTIAGLSSKDIGASAMAIALSIKLQHDAPDQLKKVSVLLLSYRVRKASIGKYIRICTGDTKF